MRWSAARRRRRPPLWRLELRQHGRETILINLKVAIPLTTGIRLGQNRPN